MLTINDRKKLDKYYTKLELTNKCVKTLINKLGLDATNERWLEPSAGSGNFLITLDSVGAIYEAYDLVPEHDNIIKADFLDIELQYNNYITIGNPPFGKRCSLAIEFFNKCAKHSKIIAMVLPNSFLKHSVQSKLADNFKLIHNEHLQEDGFTLGETNYSIRSVFQIWVKQDYNDLPNLRLLKRPSISHPDFNIWQHNATANSRPYVNENWTIATWRQGRHDYNAVFTRKDYEQIKDWVYTTNKQFFYIEPLTEEAYNIINKMDFNELASRNMTTPGFGKGDFVGYYEELRGGLNE